MLGLSLALVASLLFNFQRLHESATPLHDSIDHQWCRNQLMALWIGASEGVPQSSRCLLIVGSWLAHLNHETIQIYKLNFVVFRFNNKLSQGPSCHREGPRVEQIQSL
jgi:hypothetical protein